MSSNLLEIERRAFQARDAGYLKEAAELFASIVEQRPDWEHGTGFYSLASCYEELGELGLAEQSYRNALRYEPQNPIFLGGLASFLYLHGNPSEAFDYYLALLRIERANADQHGAESTKTALETLGRRMGLSDEAVAEKLKS
jgi:Flp pilus assembly protein TadD